MRASADAITGRPAHQGRSTRRGPGLGRLLRLTRHGDVTRVQLASRTSRLFGYTVSVYLADDGAGGTVLVDTGLPRAWPGLRTALAGHGGALRGAIVTHAHEDHAGNVAALAAAGVPLAMGDRTRALLAEPEAIALYRRVTWGTRAPLAPDTPRFDPAPLALVATPGHAVDHHVVWDAARETVYGGDLFLGVKVRIAHLEEEPRALVRALRAVAALRPRRLFDGHRGLVEHPAPLLEAKAAWTEDVIDRVEALAARGWPDARIRDAVLGREPVTGLASRGEYSKLNLVRVVRAGR
jgi:glyoxylase-like metal-dependent hydrolase (beta-lactamase superfamily II)